MIRLKQLLTIMSVSISFILFGCGTSMPIAQETGKNDVAYILISSAGKNENSNVLVTIDNSTTFKAKTVKRKQANEKGISYQIKPGKRHVVISRQDDKLFDGIVFISQQETKIIQIP